MNNSNNRLIRILSHIGAKSIAVALVVFFVAVGIAVYIGVRLYDTEKEVLQHQGELNAKEAATEYNRYLITRMNIVTLVGCNVENMLAESAEKERIEKYLTIETENVIATMDPDTTGLYGWFDGTYLDGSGWTPDEDYVATERPWYTQSLASDSKITFIEPYLDAQTNTIMMTVSELLSDGHSVLAMDVSLMHIQKIIEQIASETEGSQAFVMDEDGSVVAHSDREQLERDYLDEPESLGGAVARLVIDGHRRFDLETPEGNYSVYVDELEGGWYSVSLINSNVWYHPLRQTMILFALILILLVAFLVFVFVRLHEKNLALETLHTRIDQEKLRGKKFQALSETDRMTGLFDHVNGEQKVNRLLSDGVGGMFMELDIDHFKNINDTYGHQTGDLVIHAVADALRSTFRTSDVTMRLGGDEFGVYAVGIVDREIGEFTIRRMFQQLDEQEIPELNGGEFCISVGAVLWDGEQKTSFEDLYALADSAMYLSKKTNGHSLTFSDFEPNMKEA